jgi:hypothetical protein
MKERIYCSTLEEFYDKLDQAGWSVDHTPITGTVWFIFTFDDRSLKLWLRYGQSHNVYDYMSRLSSRMLYTSFYCTNGNPLVYEYSNEFQGIPEYSQNDFMTFCEI